MSNKISADEWKNMRNFEVQERTLPCGKVVTAEYVRSKKGLIRMHLKICKVCKDIEIKNKAKNAVVIDDRTLLSNKSIKRTGKKAPEHSAIFHCFSE